MSSPMMRRLGERLVLALVLGVGSVSLAGCERDASGLTEWTPADHDHQVEPKRRRAGPSNLPATPHAAPSKRNQVIDVTWARQCATCHGKRGRGDGPQSMMVKARDLSSPEWQASVSDEQLTKVIREGKDKMPAFNLPDNVIAGLVEHVRGLVRKSRGGGAPERDEDEAPEAEPAAAQNAPASAATKTPAPAPAEAADKPAQAAPVTPSPATPSPAAPTP
jgi:cytochrome c oxidase cbb3-type subunit 3